MSMTATEVYEIPPAPKKRRFSITRVLGLIGIVVAAGFWLIPILVVVMTSLRSEAEFNQNGAMSFPSHLTLDSYKRAWDVGEFSTVYRNSILITAVKVPLGVMISALCAYALTKLKLKLATPLLVLLLIGLTVPVYVTLMPMFMMLRRFELINNLWGLLPPYIAFGLAFEILVLRAYFRSIPDELIEAARLDGASEIGIFLRIVLPLSLPALAALAIIDAVSTWNEFLIALTVLSTHDKFTIPLGLLNFQGLFTMEHTALNAAILLSIGPILLLYLVMQRWIVSGLTTGSLKG
jgi:raffinose/stachyose/melibiose transport system permease protein